MSGYLHNKEFCLRAPEPEDLDLLYHIENNPSLWEISGVTVPYSRYTLKEYIENCSNDIFVDRQLRLMIVRKSDNQVVGIVDLADFDPLHNRAAVGIVVLQEYRNQGVGKQALRLVCAYCLDYLHLHQLYAYIPCGNAASLNLFTAACFSYQVILPKWIRTSNGYEDAYLVQYIKE